jgi:antitoxin component YwqK of YwqJK toxin-antitoxin module
MENQNHVHSFVDTVVPATCTQQGYTLHRCACGYEYKDRFVPVGAHSFEVLEQTEPTCTDAGSQSLHCTLCDLTQMRPIPPKGHTWGKWNLLTVPTCLEPGSKNRVCTCCGYEDVHPIKPTGHRLTSPQKGKRGTVAYFCENCGQTVHKKSLTRRILRWAIPLGIVAVFATAALISWPYLKPVYHYHMASRLMEKEDYTKAYYHLQDCKDYKDSRELLEDFTVLCGKRTWYDRSGKMTGWTETTYDESANQVNFVRFNAAGNVQEKAESRYDHNGNLIFQTSYDANGKMDYKCETEYNEAGQKTLVIFYDANGMTKKIRQEYDENGNCLRTTEQDGKGKVVGILTQDYDSHNNILQSVTYDAKGNQTAKQTNTYQYDAQGNVTREIRRGTDNVVLARYNRTYDEANNMLTETRYNAKGEKVYVYTYNSRGNVIRFVSYKNGRPDSITENTYDAQGNGILSVYYDGEDQVTGKTETTYKNGVIKTSISYDAKGNVIRRNEYSPYGDMTLEVLYGNDGKVKYKSETKFEYDKYGNTTSVTTYDTDGNMVECTRYENHRIIYKAG